MSIETTSHARSLAIVKPGSAGTRTKSPLARRTGLWPSTVSQHSPISTRPKPAKFIRERRTAQRPAPSITFVPIARGRSRVITSANGSMSRTIYNGLLMRNYRQSCRGQLVSIRISLGDENGSDYWQLVGLRQSNCTALPQQWLECRCDDASASRRPLQRKFEQFACNCARRDRCGECSGGRQRSARCVRWRRRPRQQCRLWSVLAARNDLGRVDPPLVSNQYAWHHRDGPVNRAAHAPAWLGHDCQRHVQCRIQSRASRFRVCCNQNRSRGLLGSALPRACAVWHPCKIGRAWLRTGHQVPSKHDGVQRCELVSGALPAATERADEQSTRIHNGSRRCRKRSLFGSQRYRRNPPIPSRGRFNGQHEDASWTERR